jgi:hypothetical protein
LFFEITSNVANAFWEVLRNKLLSLIEEAKEIKERSTGYRKARQ